MKLDMNLKQQQVLSPQMIQSMEILQMGTQELQEYVEKTLLENPTLELEHEQRRDDSSRLLRKMEWLNANDRQNRTYYRDDARDLTELAADLSGEDLYDHLREQLDLSRLPGRLAIAVDCVLSGLNRNGYLEESVSELSARCGQREQLIQQAEELVRALEPAGVAARTLSECLAIQLRRKGETGLALTIVERYLEDMSQSHFHHIAKATGADREAIQEACHTIRSLDPRPGACYMPREAPSYLLPDLLVTEEEGKFVVTPCDDFLPLLRVNTYYRQLMTDTDEAEVRNYLTDKVRQAEFLVKNINQRKHTMLKCAGVIVARQEDFFRHGTGYLKPLSLADVAQELDVHESTVSRAVKGKNLQCRQGVLPLTWFFSRALDGSGDVSAQQAKSAIKELIDGEDKRKPLSDQKLCELLEGRGIAISRRTVAKYRDQLGYPSAPGRKEF